MLKQDSASVLFEAPKKEGNPEVLNTPFIFQSMMIDPLCMNYKVNKSQVNKSSGRQGIGVTKTWA